MKSFLLGISMLIHCLTLNAQDYEPIPFHDNQKEIANYLNAKSKSLKSDFNSYPVKNGKIIKSFLNNRKELISELTEENFLIIDQELNGYLNEVLHEIAKDNGINASDLKAYISRETSPNAYSLGEGTFVFHISLLSRLENEEQLKFIIGHELSHFTLDHLGREMAAKMSYSKSDEYKTKIKNIKKSKFNRYSRSVDEFKNFQYGSQNERRKRELEADSLGFKYIKSKLDNPYNAILALQVLDSVSPAEIVKVSLENYKKHFSTESKPFDEDWTRGYDFSKYNYQSGKVNVFGVHVDSLSSHPERIERQERLKAAMPDPTPNNTEVEDRYTYLKQKFRYEEIYAHYALEEYGRGIYLILQLQELENLGEKENIFYSKMLSKFYAELAESRKKFEFKKYVDDINYKHFTEEYRLFLTILDNLKSSEMEALSEKFKIN